MAEPTSILTFKDLITRIAKEARISSFGPTGEDRAMPPVDVYDLELCKDAVNDGIREFISDAPETGWRWRRRIMSVTLTGTRTTGVVDSATNTDMTDAALMATYTVSDEILGWYVYILTGTGAGSYAAITTYDEGTGQCFVAEWLDEYGNTGGTIPVTDDTYAITPVETVGGDISRYLLPENFFGGVTGPITYQRDSAHSSLIKWTDESFIRRQHAVTTSSGYPRFAAIRPWEPASDAMESTRRRELIVYPQPASAEIVEFPYELVFDDLDMETGVVDSGSATTLVDTTRTEPDDYFNGWRMEILSGAAKGSNALVTDWDNGTGTFTVTDWLKPDGTGGAPDPDTDMVYIVEPANNLHPAGAAFDQAILSSSLMQAERIFPDIDAGYTEKYIKKDLLQAYKIDARSAPRKLGTSNRGRHVQSRHWTDVEYN